MLDGEGSVESVGAQLGAMLKERLSIQDLGNARQSAAPSNPGGGDESLLNSINREGEGDTALMMGKLQSRQIGKRQVSDPGVAPPSMVGAVDIGIPQSYTGFQAHPGSVPPNPYAKGSGAQIIGQCSSHHIYTLTMMMMMMIMMVVAMVAVVMMMMSILTTFSASALSIHIFLTFHLLHLLPSLSHYIL